jgi:hypothetical protein
MLQSSGWLVTRAGGRSTFKKVEGKQQWVLAAPNVQSLTAQYKTPLDPAGQLQWTMIQLASARESAMLVLQLNGLVDQDDQPIFVRVIPGAQKADMGEAQGTWEQVFEDIDAPMQWSLGFDELAGRLVLRLAGQELVSMPAKRVEPMLKLQVDVTRGNATITQMHWDVPTPKSQTQPLPEMAIRFTDSDWVQLLSSWRDYFGVHYTTEAPANRWGTVRGYGSPHISPPRDGVYREDATLRTGPFADDSLKLDVQDICRRVQGKQSTTHLGQMLPQLFDAGLDAIYQVPLVMRDAEAVRINKNLAYWTIRLACEVNPDAAAKHVFWQWGNEVNGLHLDLFGDKEKVQQGRSRWAFSNQSEKATAYAEHVMAPGVEVMRQVGKDVYGDPSRLPVVCGSLGNSYNPKSRAWLDKVMDHVIKGDDAPSLAGKRMGDLVDILTVHYPLGTDQWDKSLGAIHDKYMSHGTVKGIWITEEHGMRGAGPVTILQRGMRFLDWASLYGLDAHQTRLCWWGTDRPKPGGKASLAIDLLGRVLGDAPLKMAVHLSLTSRQRICVLWSEGSGRPTKLLVVLLPGGQGEGQSLSASRLTVEGLPAQLPGVVVGKLIQFSQSQIPVEKQVAVAVGDKSLIIELDAVITEPSLVQIDLP